MTDRPANLLTSIRSLFTQKSPAPPHASEFPVSKPEPEWRETLKPDQYRVLREHGTERPGASPLLKEKRSGMFRCAGCGEALYESDAKFDSGTGWPSFTSAVEGGVETTEDRSLLMQRTEVHCRNCGGHLGHVFNDGPAPTGMRHCINGAALDFDPEEAGGSEER